MGEWWVRGRREEHRESCRQSGSKSLIGSIGVLFCRTKRQIPKQKGKAVGWE